MVLLLQNVAKKYPEKYVILSPVKRDANGRVMDWQLLNHDRSYRKMKDLADYYRKEGLKSAVIISTAERGMDVPPEESAKFFRIFFNMITIAGVSLKFPMKLGISPCLAISILMMAVPHLSIKKVFPSVLRYPSFSGEIPVQLNIFKKWKK